MTLLKKTNPQSQIYFPYLMIFSFPPELHGDFP